MTVSHGARRIGAGGPGPRRCCIETHVGTFTKGGTYRAMIDRLDHLVKTGITALELMPLADFAGRRGWGYDGVLWYAPDSAYGRPEDLKTLIDEAHRRGLMVFLDVVYNHFGPEGNFLGRYAPDFFTDAHTPWGSAIDYRVTKCAPSRSRTRCIGCAIIASTVSGLTPPITSSRSPVSHRCCMISASPPESSQRRPAGTSISCWKMATTARACSTPRRSRPAENTARSGTTTIIMPGTCCSRARPRAITATTSVRRASISRERCRQASSTRAKPRPSGATSRAASRAEGCRLRPLSISCRTTTRSAIVRFGDRLETLASAKEIEAALAVTLLSPMIPMLFMGEEWGSKVPFPFFCDFEGDLADAVRNGRKQEYKWAYEKYGDEVPDPLELSTFESAVLDWQTRRHADRRQTAGAGAGAARHSPPRNHAATGGRELWQRPTPLTTACSRPTGAWAMARRCA